MSQNYQYFHSILSIFRYSPGKTNDKFITSRSFLSSRIIPMSRVRKASDELLYTIRSLVTVRARWLSNRVKPHLLERLSSYSCIQVRESRFRDEIKKKKKNFISSAIRSTVHACPRHINCNRRWKVAIGYQSTGTRRQVKTTERLVFVLILFPSEKSVR